MFNLMVGFLRGIGSLAWPWWVWIGVLVLVNGVVPFVFFGALEAKVVLGAFLLAAAIQMLIFRQRGFVRLLGMGHIVVWVPLLVWLWFRLRAIGIDSPFGRWLLVVVLLDGLSLIIDVVDVYRYRRETGKARGGLG